jgi:sialate O-acetylesterase
MDFTLSNKVKTFAGVANMDQEIANANWPQIRMFTVDLKLADTPQQDVTGHWAVCSPQTAGDMSAVAYFFARDLFQDQKVPFGIIDSTWGASSAQCWASRDALVSVPQLKPLVDDYDRTVAHYTPEKAQADYQAAIQKWKADSDVAKAAGKRAPRKPGEPRDPHQDQHNPYLLYNGMIYPVKPYGVKGVIWYQGESNGPTADEYFLIMKTLIDDWRTDWGKPDMPFLFVQLANIKPVATDPGGRSQVATIRNQQLKTLSVPNTAMAVTIDIGDVNSVHPKDKQDVGKRLALAAQALVYHENVPYSGPIYSSMSVEGSTIRIHFTHTDGGLVTKDGTAPTGFAIAGSDGKWAWADAKIDGDTVVLSSASVPAPTQARYGWADNPPVNLYNGAKLPASPFETTDN